MPRICPVCLTEFDDAVPMCPTHVQPTRPAPAEANFYRQVPEVLSVRLAGMVQPVPPGPGLLIGRSPHSPFGAHLEGIGWTNISGQHCILRLTVDQQVEVLDLDSRNGTFVDGVRLAPNTPRLIQPGESLRLAVNREVNLSWR